MQKSQTLNLQIEIHRRANKTASLARDKTDMGKPKESI